MGVLDWAVGIMMGVLDWGRRGKDAEYRVRPGMKIVGGGMTMGGRNDDGPDRPISSTEDFLQGSCIQHLVQPVIQLGLAGLFDALFEVVGQWTKFM